MATYYLATASNGGSDSNNGTAVGTPWLTFAKVANSGVDGSTVYVIGHATETFATPVYSTVQWSKGFIFRGYNLDENRELTGGDTYPLPKVTNSAVHESYNFYSGGNKLMEFHNIWFDNIDSYRPFSFEGNGNFQNARFKFYNCNFSRFNISGGSYAAMFASSTYTSTATDPGFYLEGCNMWDIGSSDGNGMIVVSSYAGVHHFKNVSVYLKDKGAGTSLNTFWYLQNYGNDRVVMDNVIIKSDRTIQFTYSDAYATDTYNTVHNVAFSGLSYVYAPLLVSKIDITADPQFMDITSDIPNLNLKPSSPCFSAGSTV